MLTITPEDYKFLVNVASNLLRPDKPVHKHLDPTFYHTLTYEGDMALIEQLENIINKYKLQAQDYLLP
jgi:hypothetical protein